MIAISREASTALNFAIQVIVGTVLFSLVLLATFGLAMLIEWMDARGAPTWMIIGSVWVEWLLFALDLFCFGLFLLSEAFRFARQLMSEW